MIVAQQTVDLGIRDGLDMGETIEMLDGLKARVAETEAALDEARLAAGLGVRDGA